MSTAVRGWIDSTTGSSECPRARGAITEQEQKNPEDEKEEREKKEKETWKKEENEKKKEKS